MNKPKYFGLRFLEAIAFFRNKLNVTTDSWTVLWKEQHDKAFTVAGAMNKDLLNDFRTAIEKAQNEGTGYAQFRESFDELVKKYGWDHKGSAGWRSRVIYKTNMRTSYQAGRYQQQISNIDYAPWGLYKHSDFVAVPRPIHVSWNGTVLRLDDPWWDTHYAPNGWGCECYIVTLTDRGLKRRGLISSEAPKENLVPYRVGTRKGPIREGMIDEGIDPGWDYHPGKTTVKGS